MFDKITRLSLLQGFIHMLSHEGAQEAGVDDLHAVLVKVVGLIAVKGWEVVQGVKAHETFVQATINIAFVSLLSVHFDF